MTAPAPRNHLAEEGRITVSVEVDSEDLRHHAEQLADRGEHGPAHVLFTAAAHMEAGGEIPPWIGTVVDDDEDRLTGPRLEPMVAHPAPTPAPVAVPDIEAMPIRERDDLVSAVLRFVTDRGYRVTMPPRNLPIMDARPEPVVAPLPSEAVKALADVIVATMHRFDNAVPDAAKRMVAWGYAQSIVAAGYGLVPEDDEDTVRVPREAVERLRAARLSKVHMLRAAHALLDTLDGTR